jgi:hypothetical protein
MTSAKENGVAVATAGEEQAKADGSTEQSPRKTHIEVCVRIRPLVIVSESSNSFLLDRNGGKANAASASSSSSVRGGRRKGQIARPGTVSSASRGGGSRFRNLLFKRSNSNDSEDDNSSIYAWERVGATTVKQSPDTNLIQGRTHMYTLDQVYGPNDITQSVFDKSVQELIHAAVDGYHTSVLAYGQTATGKTHTMTGTTKG